MGQSVTGNNSTCKRDVVARDRHETDMRPRWDRDEAEMRPRWDQDVWFSVRDETETFEKHISKPSQDRDVETKTRLQPWLTPMNYLPLARLHSANQSTVTHRNRTACIQIFHFIHCQTYTLSKIVLVMVPLIVQAVHKWSWYNSVDLNITVDHLAHQSHCRHNTLTRHVNQLLVDG